MDTQVDTCSHALLARIIHERLQIGVNTFTDAFLQLPSTRLSVIVGILRRIGRDRSPGDAERADSDRRLPGFIAEQFGEVRIYPARAPRDNPTRLHVSWNGNEAGR